MPRTNLTDAREAKELGKVELAELLGCEYKSVIAWEAGTQTPRLKMCRKIREVLGNDDPNLFDNFPSSVPDETQAPPSCVETHASDKLDSSDSQSILESEEGTDMDPRRRKINTTIATGAIVASGVVTLVNTVQIVQGPVVKPDAYIDLAKASIPIWWNCFKTGNYSELEATLNRHIPVLREIATSVGPFQYDAISLAIQAKIMQAQLASGNLKYREREAHCVDAVQIANLSDDGNLLALAQFWQADTFCYCYERPQKAIKLLNNALSNVSNIDGNPLLRSAIYADLSIASAQNRNQKDALDYAILARSTMPNQPELDTFYESIGIGPSELNQLEGKMLLYLAEHFPDEYAQTAYDALNKSTTQQATSKGLKIQALVRKADASRLLGRKDECMTLLTKSFEVGPSRHKLSQMKTVLASLPDNWQNETDVLGLRKDVSNKLVVARKS